MPAVFTPQERRDRIEQIRRFPAELEAAVQGLTDEQLTTRYDPTEWSVAQNIHHLVDSHMNAYIRTRLLLTEDHPTVRPYDQDAWAELADAKTADLSDSLLILRAMHARWTRLLDSLSDTDFRRVGKHPAIEGDYTIDDVLDIYAQHGTGHIEQLQRQLAAGGVKK
ncbi:MAG: putative metal-dependent hydrolase [Anaerolineae bacterium]|nr:putative metal-dependent hydrolase [Anaerolineae bacterium]